MDIASLLNLSDSGIAHHHSAPGVLTEKLPFRHLRGTRAHVRFWESFSAKNEHTLPGGSLKSTILMIRSNCSL